MRGSLDALAPLRGRLRQERVFGRKAGSTDSPEPSGGKGLQDTERAGVPPSSADASDNDLLRAVLRDVKPLPGARQRAEIETPKPSPVPRPRTVEAADEAPARPRRHPEFVKDSELFRAAMEDVTPMLHGNRADIGVHRNPARHRETDRELPADQAGFDTIPQLPPDADELDPGALFRHVARGAKPVNANNRAELSPPAARPQPLKHDEDERAALRESLEAPLSLEDRLEMGDEAAFLRPGLPRRVLTDLRRGRWVLQGQLDLHGLNRDEARKELSCFLGASLQHGHRCVRVIHGKGLGSPGKESILKQLSRGWLAQREEILAFCQAGPHDGGSGALLVLLRAGSSPRN